MLPPPFRIGIVGTGHFARTHMDALRSVPSLTLAAACDTNLSHLSAFTDRFGGTPCTDLTEMQKHDLDLIVITTPDHTHAEIIKHVLLFPTPPKLLIVEKPLCISEAELQDIGSRLLTTKTMLVIDHSRRFNDGFMRLKHLIDSGELGMLRSVSWQYYAGWFHTGVHAIDTLRMLIGECTCLAAKQTGPGRAEDDPLLSVTLAAKDHPTVAITLEGLPDKPYELFEAQFHFSAGRIRIHWNDIFIDRLREGTYAPMLWFSEHFEAEPTVRALARMYESAVSLLNGEDAPLLASSDFAAARGTMKVLFAAKKASGT